MAVAGEGAEVGEADGDLREGAVAAAAAAVARAVVVAVVVQ